MLSKSPKNSCESKRCVIKAKLNNGLFINALLGDPRLFLIGPEFLDRFAQHLGNADLDPFRFLCAADYNGDRLAAHVERLGEIAIGQVLLEHEEFDFKVDHG